MGTFQSDGGVGVGLNFLREKDCEKIHEASLWEVLHDRGAFRQRNGTRSPARTTAVGKTRDGCTLFPAHAWWSALEAVPPSSSIAGRPTTISTWRDQVYASQTGEGIFTHDLETGERRSTVKQDAVDILRVVDCARQHPHLQPRHRPAGRAVRIRVDASMRKWRSATPASPCTWCPAAPSRPRR